MLSRREEPNVLKIGMTNRSIEKRIKEINSATGVLFPFSVKRVFKV
ncbi:GIY-YIG nuclease family protein [Bacillus kandeliae]